MRALVLVLPWVPFVLAAGCGSTHGAEFDPDGGAARPVDAGGPGEPLGDGGSQGAFSNDASNDADDSVDPHTPVDVLATADNAYGFGWGDANSLTNYIANPPSVTAGDIFNCPVGGPARKGAPLSSGTSAGPEAYTVPAEDAPPGAYLYLITWADYSTTQGVIGQFKRQGGTAVYTGAGDWQACATGVPFPNNGDTGPTQSAINAQITICNAGSGDPSTTSAGWVGPSGPVTSTPSAVGKIVFGQDNSDTSDMRGTPGHDFPPTCGEPSWKDPDNGGIDPGARWMWYAPPGFTGDAFVADGTNTTRTFLVFRLPAKAVPGPPR